MEQIEPNVGGVMLSKRERKRERERGETQKIHQNLPQTTTMWY